MNDVVNTGSGSKMTLTLKADKGYDAPWLVFHADNIPELADMIGAAEHSGLLARVAEIDGSLKAHYQAGSQLGATPVQSPAAAQAEWDTGQGQQAAYGQPDVSQQDQQWAAQQQYGQQPPPQQQYAQQPPPQQYQQQAPPPQAPPGPPPQCMHGPKVWKPGGMSKTNKPYSATWNCALKFANYKDPNGCPVQWIKD